MVSDGSWHVLIECDVRGHDWVAGESATYYRWELARSQAAPGGREQAREAAEEFARTYVPKEGADPQGRPSRKVYRQSADSWLVEVGHQYWKRHFRVSVAELVHTEDEAPAPRPVAAEPPKRGLFGRR